MSLYHFSMKTSLLFFGILALMSPAFSGTAPLCTPGFYSSTGSSPCMTVPAGNYAVFPGTITYTPCNAGTFSIVPGAVNPGQCTSCTPPTWSPSGSTSCSNSLSLIVVGYLINTYYTIYLNCIDFLSNLIGCIIIISTSFSFCIMSLL